jgi:hypothetical protein
MAPAVRPPPVTTAWLRVRRANILKPLGFCFSTSRSELLQGAARAEMNAGDVVEFACGVA